ncbi:MAG: hypothetical protein ABIQ05_03505 [Candidatus Limnocylindria bacterium]
MQNPPDDSDLLFLRRSFVRHLAADRRSAATRSAYATAIAQLEAFLIAQRWPTSILARCHALVRFFAWLVDEGELPASPMTPIPAPLAAVRIA